MKKIRLDPETLAVQSFATMGLPRGRGTVRGAENEVAAPTAEYGDCRQTNYNCESGNCAPSGINCGGTGPDCILQPWTQGQNTCPGMLGC
jgi:hypothetical protein